MLSVVDGDGVRLDQGVKTVDACAGYPPGITSFDLFWAKNVLEEMESLYPEGLIEAIFEFMATALSEQRSWSTDGHLGGAADQIELLAGLLVWIRDNDIVFWWLAQGDPWCEFRL